MVSPLSRRSFLAGTAGLAVVTACGGSDGDGSGSDGDLTSPVTFPADGTPPLVPAGSPTLGVRFPDGLRGVMSGFEAGLLARAPFTANDADTGFPLGEDAPESMDVVVQFEGEVVSEQTVAREALGEFTPYYPVIFAPEAEGMYAVISDFAPEAPAWLVVNPAGTLVHPVLGDTLPTAPTPTFDDDLGFEKICTRSPEPCPFHEVTLDEALAAGGPVALLLATPEFCQTDTCGPSVDQMITIAPDFGDITVIHAEVYTEPPTDGAIPLAPLPLQYEMQWEPALWVTDGQGTIVSELHWAMSSNEIRGAMETA
ncbi:MAG: hypothetical protein OES57_05840 [Acidimicrobiia bacterium]|nr:hypothetical protein [Acidimicrobiia bacterium]